MMVAGITGLVLPAGGLLGSDIGTALSEIERYLVRRMAGFCSGPDRPLFGQHQK